MVKDVTPDIWKMEGGKRKTWWWWFWLFFFNNPEKPKEPRQLMILWSKKRERHILCNDVMLDMNEDVHRSGNELEFSGATAAWFYDGKKMHEDFVVTPSRLQLSGSKRSLSAKESSFSQKGDQFTVKISGKQASIDFKMQQDPDFPPFHKDSHFLDRIGYNILKINRLNLSGKIKSKGSIQTIAGTAYFQKVFVNGIVIPWQWGMVHFHNGSIITYNIGRLGHSLFAEHHQPLDIKLRKKLEFYDAKSNMKYFFRNVRIRRTPGKLPSFTLDAKSREAELHIELNSYSRALWRLQKSRRHSINTLYYHEFCVSAKEFRLKTSDGRMITLHETGPAVGNCEDSKGMMI
ncbi:MAG: hypothetical protein ABIG96_04970 [Candidatus Micrarchaeota archaeon]